ncbi:MAG: ABC transporter substrate-binding protein [Gammaproteobacteria bacterium]|nr:ABC transporter substrate-binding protein [Gammaproteobacteria bacterium]
MLATAIAVGSAGITAASAETEMVVVSWGGAYTKSQQLAYHDPYMAKNPGVKIVNDDSSSEAAAKIRAQAEAGNITWDLVDVEPDVAIALCDEGLLVEFDYGKDFLPAPDGTSAADDFGAAAEVSPCFVPQIVFSTTFGYRTDILKNGPKTIHDVFDLKKFPGKRSLQKHPVGNLEWALIADGVDAADVYDVLDTEAGVDRAFAKLDTIKDQVVWWSKGAQPGQLLADGEVVIASAYNGRLFAAIEENNQPIGMMWDWQLFGLDGWVVPKGAPNMAEVMTYLKFATDTQRLADQAKYIAYGPARASSAPLVGKHEVLGIEMGPHMPTAPANAKHTILKDVGWWADHNDELRERFEAWLAS